MLHQLAAQILKRVLECKPAAALDLPTLTNLGASGDPGLLRAA